MRIRKLLIAAILTATTGCVFSTSDTLKSGSATIAGRVTRYPTGNYGQAIVEISCANGQVKTSVAADSAGGFTVTLDAPPEVFRHAGPWVTCDFGVENVDLLWLDNMREIYFTPSDGPRALQQLAIFGP